MKTFSLKEQSFKLLSPEIISLISSVEEKKGLTFALPKKKKLNRLHDFSKRRSVTSSNKIEGIEVTKRREEQLFLENASAKSKEDYSLLGYNKALTYMMENYKNLSLEETLIKDLHYMVYQDYSPDFGGKYKVIQNYINSYDSKGNYIETVFTPSKPEDVQGNLGNLIWQFNDAASNPITNKLILIFIFILDFLCIHPFSDGNGRISRLLTTFLLLKFGYSMDEYYSLSYLLLEHQNEYYRSLNLSDKNWHENGNDPTPFVHFHLLRLIEGYKCIGYILEISDMDGKCIDKVLRVIKDYKLPTPKSYIEEILFEYTRTSIEKALSELLGKKLIAFVSKGSIASYKTK
jgi:Fic family protein